nr:hypothetical protein Iba_chr08dCG4910 [Ipomoea batatas]
MALLTEVAIWLVRARRSNPFSLPVNKAGLSGTIDKSNLLSVSITSATREFHSSSNAYFPQLAVPFAKLNSSDQLQTHYIVPAEQQPSSGIQSIPAIVLHSLFSFSTSKADTKFLQPTNSAESLSSNHHLKFRSNLCKLNGKHSILVSQLGTDPDNVSAFTNVFKAESLDMNKNLNSSSSRLLTTSASCERALECPSLSSASLDSISIDVASSGSVGWVVSFFSFLTPFPPTSVVAWSLALSPSSLKECLFSPSISTSLVASTCSESGFLSSSTLGASFSSESTGTGILVLESTLSFIVCVSDKETASLLECNLSASGSCCVATGTLAGFIEASLPDLPGLPEDLPPLLSFFCLYC